MSPHRALGVVVDLDDTLYPQADFLASAVAAVALRGEELGIARVALARALSDAIARGSDSGRTINDALEMLGYSSTGDPLLLEQLVEAFVGHQPTTLTCYPGVSEGLSALRARAPLALLTDGRPEIQRAKLRALGITERFDLVLITDEAGGRERRKPDPFGLEQIAAAFAVDAASLVIIGDRPDKDVAMALSMGAPVVRIQQGEYRASPSPEGVVTVDDFPSACEVVIGLLSG